jgi:hypothetical protein
MRQVLMKLDLVPRGGNYESVRRRMSELGITPEHLRQVYKGRRPSACTDPEVADAVQSSRSLAEVLGKLGIRPGGNQGRMRVRIDEMGLDTSHFVGQDGEPEHTSRSSPQSHLTRSWSKVDTLDRRPISESG